MLQIHEINRDPKRQKGPYKDLVPIIGTLYVNQWVLMNHFQITTLNSTLEKLELLPRVVFALVIGLLEEGIAAAAVLDMVLLNLAIDLVEDVLNKILYVFSGIEHSLLTSSESFLSWTVVSPHFSTLISSSF